MVDSVYIHVPFCLSKCNYCSFVSFEGVIEQHKESYIKALKDEIGYYYKKEPLKTLYFGGGTPSLLETSDFQEILSCFEFQQNAEITVEVNPETVDLKYFEQLKELGINRISVGIQSFDDEILKNIGRAHTAERAKQAVKEAQRAGFENISVDFIYGLPNQSLDAFVDDLKQAIGLGVQHISLYGLKIDDDCKFANNPPENLADDDMQADMYLAAVRFLKENGFLHYEISNFCRENYHSRHNLMYWESSEYYGFGAGAHGYIDGVRYANFNNLDEYKMKYKQKEVSLYLAKNNMLEEKIYLGFRKGDGIDVAEINSKFDLDFDETYSKVLKKYTESGHILQTEKGYKLSEDGFLLSNIILAEFLR